MQKLWRTGSKETRDPVNTNAGPRKKLGLAGATGSLLLPFFLCGREAFAESPQFLVLTQKV